MIRTIALVRRLDDHYGIAEARDDAIARGETPGQRRLAQVVLRDEGSVAPHSLEQAPVAPGVDDYVP